MEDINDLRHVMDFIGSTEEDNSYDEVLLTFIENSLFLSSAAHNWHLQCHFYTKHLQLDELYKELPEYVDAFVEGIMNNRGALQVGTGNSYRFTHIEESVPILEEYVEQCRAIHDMLEESGDYGSVNTLEDIMSFVEGVLYKLKVLQ
ncbi:DUF5856 family protein [Escherichia coli]|nr:hypothetical protein [Escherichia coli]HEA3649808.1 hypothetical protein [Escherichia coli]